MQRLLNAIIDFLPNPLEVPPVQGTDPRDESEKMTRPADKEAPFSALVFKVVSDTHGDLTYARLYSGTLKKGTRVLNPGNGRKENISRIYEMHAKDRAAQDEVYAGQIVALIGLKNSVTGDTLCDPNDPIILERMDFPEPVISMAIEPATQEDKKKLGEALTTLHREDPSFRSQYNDETGETIISGMGELHLEIVQNKLIRDMGINVNVGTPRVSYRETITGTAEDVRGKFVKQSGGRGQFGDVVLTVEPYTAAQAEEDELTFKNGVVFVDDISQGVIPREYIPSVASRLPRRFDLRHSRRIPHGERKGHVDLRLVPRGRLQSGGLRTSWCPGLPPSLHAGRPGPARTHHEGDDSDARRILRHRLWRPRQPRGTNQRLGDSAATSASSPPKCHCRRCSATPRFCVA